MISPTVLNTPHDTAHIIQGEPASRSCSGATKTDVNSHRRQTVHRGKVDPGVSELPRGNELSWGNVNRP